MTVQVDVLDFFDSVTEKVRAAKGFPSSQCIRFITAGREMYPDDPVADVAGDVLHCIVSEHGPKHGSDLRMRVQTEQRRIDWFDVVDPGVVLMWIFGLMLGLFWLLFFLRRDMFDNASVAMLTLMTLAFLVPCIASQIPWGSRLPDYDNPEEPQEAGSSRNHVSSQNGNITRRTASNRIPPRPQAQVAC